MSDYGFIHEDRVFTPNATQGVPPGVNSDRNAAIERAELDAWSKQPDVFVAYYKLASENSDTPQAFGRSGSYRASFQTHGIVTTWPGTQIGVVTEARVYPHNFGGRMVSLRVKGNNGAEYYGRASYDWGSVVRLRKVRV